jgi:hypothetical protein
MADKSQNANDTICRCSDKLRFITDMINIADSKAGITLTVAGTRGLFFILRDISSDLSKSGE